MSESAGGNMVRSQKAVVKGKKKSFSGCFKAPFRLLRRARDMYVKSLGGCAGAGGGSRGGGFTTGVMALMPRARSRSVFGQSNRFSSGEDDFGDLVRASSKGRAVAVVAVKRSQSMPVIERIEEEKEEKEEKEEEVYERCRSYAVPPPRFAVKAS